MIRLASEQDESGNDESQDDHRLGDDQEDEDIAEQLRVLRQSTDPGGTDLRWVIAVAKAVRLIARAAANIFTVSCQVTADAVSASASEDTALAPGVSAPAAGV